jgi:flagellar motor component MotA
VTYRYPTLSFLMVLVFGWLLENSGMSRAWVSVVVVVGFYAVIAHRSRATLIEAAAKDLDRLFTEMEELNEKLDRIVELLEQIAERNHHDALEPDDLDDDDWSNTDERSDA